MFASLSTPVQPAVRNVLLSTIARRLTPQPIKLRADIELTCYTPAGIDAIKKALRAGEGQSTEAVPIKAKLVAPPLYVLGTNATDKVYTIETSSTSLKLILISVPPIQYAAVERLEKAIDAIQSTIEDQGGSLTVKMKVCFMSLGRFDALTGRASHSPRRFRRPKSRTSHSSWRRRARKTPKYPATKTRRKCRHAATT